MLQFLFRSCLLSLLQLSAEAALPKWRLNFLFFLGLCKGGSVCGCIWERMSCLIRAIKGCCPGLNIRVEFSLYLKRSFCLLCCCCFFTRYSCDVFSWHPLWFCFVFARTARVSKGNLWSRSPVIHLDPAHIHKHNASLCAYNVCSTIPTRGGNYLSSSSFMHVIYDMVHAM